MLFFNHSSTESVRWVHLFSYNKESKVKLLLLFHFMIEFFCYLDVRTFLFLHIRADAIISVIF